MSRPTCTEAEVAAVVVAWLEAQGADVYQEVECISGVADIVVRIGAELWIVETKVALSLALLLQAAERRRSAHRVYIAAPYTRHMPDVARLCDELGIGVLVVHVGGTGPWDPPRVEERVRSRRWNTRPVALAARLRPEHKTALAAGTPGAGRSTPFRDTCTQLLRLVHDQPGITLKAAIDEIRHHYGSNAAARRSVAHWVNIGRVPGVRLGPERPALRLYPSEDS